MSLGRFLREKLISQHVNIYDIASENIFSSAEHEKLFF